MEQLRSNSNIVGVVVVFFAVCGCWWCQILSSNTSLLEWSAVVPHQPQHQPVLLPFLIHCATTTNSMTTTSTTATLSEKRRSHVQQQQRHRIDKDNDIAVIVRSPTMKSSSTTTQSSIRNVDSIIDDDRHDDTIMMSLAQLSDASSATNNNNDPYRGVKQILAVRVISTTAQEYPMESLDVIEGAIFGTGINPNRVPSYATLVGQFHAVSHHQLQFIPYNVMISPNVSAPALTSARPGVIEIDLPPNITTMMDYSDTYQYFNQIVQPALIAAITNVLQQQPSFAMIGNNTATNTTIALPPPPHHILFCLPTGSLKASAGAIADVGGMYSYFHYGSCATLQVLMHEIGHNLYFHHSNDKNGNEYADRSGYMGGNEMVPNWRQRLFRRRYQPTDINGFPRKAFNGYQHWMSGWFKDRAIQIDPTLLSMESSLSNVGDRRTRSSTSDIHTNTMYRIVSFVDYGNPAMQRRDVVLIQVGTTLYLQYNRAKDYNLDTSLETANRVTITQSTIDRYDSRRMAALAQGQSYIHRNFSSNLTAATPGGGRNEPGTTYTLIVKVCTLVMKPVGTMDYADVSIHLDDGIQQSSCPPNTGHTVRGSSEEKVDLATIVRGSLQVADPIRAVLCVLFLLSAIILILLICMDVMRCRGFLWYRDSSSQQDVDTNGLSSHKGSHSNEQCADETCTIASDEVFA